MVIACIKDSSLVYALVDGPVSQQLGWVIELTISLIMKMAAIVYMSPIFLVPGLVVGILGGWFGQIYIKAQLSVKREMSNAKSPVLSHFGAAVAGLGTLIHVIFYNTPLTISSLVSIRAYGAQNAFKQVSLDRINRYVRSARVFYNLNRLYFPLYKAKNRRLNRYLDGCASAWTCWEVFSRQDLRPISYTGIK